MMMVKKSFRKSWPCCFFSEAKLFKTSDKNLCNFGNLQTAPLRYKTLLQSSATSDILHGFDGDRIEEEES